MDEVASKANQKTGLGVKRLSIGMRTLLGGALMTALTIGQRCCDYAVSHKPIRASDVFGMLIFDLPISLVVAYIIVKYLAIPPNKSELR